MPRFDLNGDPLPEEPSSPYSGAPPSVNYGPVPGAVPPGPGSPNTPYPAPPPNVYSPAYPPHPPSYGQPHGTASSSFSAPRSTPYGGLDAGQKTILTWSVVGGILLVAGVWLCIALFPPNVPAPTSFDHYSSINHTFEVDAPKGWAITETQPTLGLPKESPDSTEVSFTSGTASITITQSKVTDIDGGDGPEDLGVNGKLRAFFAAQKATAISGDVANYQELGNPYHFATGSFGEGLCVTYIASGPKTGLPASTQGYYVAMTGGYYAMTIVCTARKSNFPMLKSAYQHVINSLSEGTVENPVVAPPKLAPSPTGASPDAGGYGRDKPIDDTTPLQ